MWQKIPRSVYFKDGKAIGTFPSQPYDSMTVINLPTDHYDFRGPIDIIGKTKEQIEKQVEGFSFPSNKQES
jgi:hypothetical protein